MVLSTILIFDILIVPTVWDTIYGSFYYFNIDILIVPTVWDTIYGSFYDFFLIFDILIVPTVWDSIYGSFYDFNTSPENTYPVANTRKLRSIGPVPVHQTATSKLTFVYYNEWSKKVFVVFIAQ